MELNIKKMQVFLVLDRFYEKLQKKNNYRREFLNFAETVDDIEVKCAYKMNCIYTNDGNKNRELLIIKFTYKNIDGLFSFNIPFDEYKDLIVSNQIFYLAYIEIVKKCKKM